ncbi:hypothetical protein QK414_37135, partial [Pseudomonas aeruginosa]|nr:hypothetical protein [Pseudomonas aeruginosa]
MASGVVGGVVDTDVPAVHALASFGIARAVLSLGEHVGGYGAQKVLNCSHIFLAGFVTQIQHYSSGMFGIATDARYFRHAVLSLGYRGGVE